MKNESSVPETKGVTIELLNAFDLGPEIEGLAGRQFRMRKVTIEPGGVIGPLHDHKGRPGLVYILQGTITDHRNGVAREYGPGLGWPEDRKLSTGLRIRAQRPRWRSLSIFSNRRHKLGSDRIISFDFQYLYISRRRKTSPTFFDKSSQLFQTAKLEVGITFRFI